DTYFYMFPQISFHKQYIIYKARESLFAAFIGLITGLAAAFLDYLIVEIHNFSFEHHLYFFQLLILAVYQTWVIWVEKNAGLPGLLLALRFLKENLVVPLFLWVAKFLGVALTLSVLPAGREGPAMLLGTGLGQYIAEIFRLPKGQLNYWGTIGAAAFVGAFLKTPLGATFYVLENRFGKVLNVDFVINALSSSTISYTVYVYFRGYHPVIPVHGAFHWNLLDIAPAFIIGVWAAALAIVLTLVFDIAKKFASLSPPEYRPLAILPVILLLFAIALNYEHFPLLNLSVDYQPLEIVAGHVIPFEAAVKAIVLEMLFLTVLLNFGYPGGVVLPLIFIGAALGNIVAASFPDKLSIFVLTGASAMLSGALKIPITALVMISEMSHRTLVIPEVVGVLTAYFLSSSVKFLKR
ncbi:MAG: chloride channel protein, partial [Aquificota bacterium]